MCIIYIYIYIYICIYTLNTLYILTLSAFVLNVKYDIKFPREILIIYILYIYIYIYI